MVFHTVIFASSKSVNARLNKEMGLFAVEEIEFACK